MMYPTKSYNLPCCKKINKKTYLIYLVEYCLIMETSSSKNQSLRYAIRTLKYKNSLMVNVCDLKINKKTYLIYLVEYCLIMETSSSKNQSLRYAIRTLKYQNSLMVNVCDLNLIDKQINHGEITINMKKNYW